MIPPAVVAAFFIGLLSAGTFVFVADRRAIQREAKYWADLKADAENGYARLFDWETEANW